MFVKKEVGLKLSAASLLCCTLLAFSLPAVAKDENLPSPENLIIEGVPSVPLSIVSGCEKYTHFRHALVSGWHPKERRMLINTRFSDTQQVHAISDPMGARTQLTFYPDRVFGGNFEPSTGDYFLFHKDKGGDEFFQVYRYDVETRDITLVTDGKSRNTSGRFSKDGKFYVYNSSRRDGKNNDIYIVDPRNPKSDKLLAEVKGEGWSVSDVSYDGKTVAVNEEISINESYLWLADVATGKLTPLTERKSGEQTSYQHIRFSPDGKGLYVTTDSGSEFQTLCYLDLSTRKLKPLTKDVKWDVQEFDMSFDGKTIAFAVNEDGYGKLYLMDTASGKIWAPNNIPLGEVSGLDWHKNGRDLAFQVQSARMPNDVFSLDVQTNKVERWTASETGPVNAANFSEPELIKWKTFDGKEISGFYYKPSKKFSGPRPVIVVIHGGPEGQSRPGYLGRLNYYLNELGVALIFPNVRGSSGYGKTFLKLDNGFNRVDSYKDIEALFDWVAKRDDLDSRRLMVTGGSYGGHMTLAISTFYPERITCAVDVVGMSNLVTFLEHTQEYRRDLRRVEYGDERDAKMREFLQSIAPLNKVDKISKPLFVVQGENDPRVPASEARQIVDATKKGGVPIWYLSAKDEGHGFAKKRNSDYQFYSTVLFVEKFLLPEKAPNQAFGRVADPIASSK